MKKNEILRIIDRFAAPVATVLCGLVLLFSPDTATALISRLLGAVALLWGIGCGLLALFGSGSRIKNGIMAVGLLMISQWLRLNPAALARGFGRLLGICLLAGAARGLSRSAARKGRALYLAEGVLGLILLVLPLTASRLVYMGCGIALVIAGGFMLLSRLRRRLDSGDPNIIDAL